MRLKEISGLHSRRNPIIRLKNANLHKSSRPMVFETGGVPILDDTWIILVYCGVSLDVTERIKLEEDLRKRNCEVEKLLKEKNEFI